MISIIVDGLVDFEEEEKEKVYKNRYGKAITVEDLKGAIDHIVEKGQGDYQVQGLADKEYNATAIRQDYTNKTITLI